MTRFQFNKRNATGQAATFWGSKIGLTWLCLWLSIAAGFGYRHLTHETAGTVQASIDSNILTSTSPKTKPIEQIRVGERVAYAINPTEELDTSLSFDVNPRTWRKITLKTSAHEVVLLRPTTWVNDHLADEDKFMMLCVPEVGINEPAEVVSIWPCPAIQPGNGRIVIGTFAHVTNETICMYIEGQDEPIRCTPNHITWSVEHKDFVEAHKLRPGNLVLCADGVGKLTKIEKIDEPIRVYNLEVQGQHVYQVSKLGILVHNTSPLGDGSSLPSRAVDELSKLNKMKRIVNRELQRSDIDDATRLVREQDMATINARIAEAAELMRKIITAPALPN